jgi:hypothetical protein
MSQPNLYDPFATIISCYEFPLPTSKDTRFFPFTEQIPENAGHLAHRGICPAAVNQQRHHILACLRSLFQIF